jgi:hypothetical protein
MSKFRLTLKTPSPTTVTYGVDSSGGYYCTVVRGKEKIAEYDSGSPGYNELEGLLQTLVRTGVLTAAGIAEANDLLPVVGHPCDLPSAEGQLAAVLLENLRVGD